HRLRHLRAVPRHRHRRRRGADVDGHDDAAAGGHLAAVQDPAVHPRRRVGAHHPGPAGELRGCRMSPEAVLDIGAQCLMIAAKLAAPILITALVVGFAISLLQSITQVQEVTLSFVPKAIAVGVALLIAGNWMITEIIQFTETMFDRIPSLLSGG